LNFFPRRAMVATLLLSYSPSRHILLRVPGECCQYSPQCGYPAVAVSLSVGNVVQQLVNEAVAMGDGSQRQDTQEKPIQ